MDLGELRKELHNKSSPAKAKIARWYFKQTPTDQFIGVTTPDRRKLSREAWELPLEDVEELMRSPIHEERSVANMILVLKYKRGDEKQKQRVFALYMRNRKTLVSWDAVDETAPYIVGPHLFDRDRRILYSLARSRRIWDRRIAIVATFYFIRKNSLQDTFHISEMLLDDREDLIHKACGWMLREAGKKDVGALEKFLQLHYTRIPCTTLRYAIERFPELKRKKYLKGTFISRRAR